MNKLFYLYKPENKELLETISLLNFANDFDKSIADFKDSDLFSFLERVEFYDFKNYDDLYYIIDLIQDSFKHIEPLSSQIRRTHKIMPLSQAKELDSKSIEWIAKQNGITIKQKLAQGRVLGVKRYNFIDNPENRVLKIVLMRLVAIAEFRTFDEGLRNKIARFIKDKLGEVNHKAQIIPNNTLLHHKHYAKFYKVYKWLNHLESIMSDLGTFKKKILKTRENLKKFIVLSLLHKHTNARILPSDLNINQKEYKIEFESNKWLLDVDINQYFNNESDLEKFKLKALELIKKDKTRLITPPPNKLKNTNSNVFIDIFRLYPLVYADSKHITMPLLLKQELQQKIINANHTKIIDINNTFHTLPESLLSKDSEVFKVFLSDIKEFVGRFNSLYYVLPDYINVFDFNDKHKSIRAYFSKAFFIYKSILVAAKMLFQSQVKENDTLLYLQKNGEGEIFVIPILVRYKKELKASKSKGLFLEKHPSKKIDKRENTDPLTQKLLKKCLQNGLKALNKNDIKYYENNKIYDIKKPQEEINNNINKIKEFYKNSRFLFKTDVRIIQDDPKENLRYFEELIQQKEAGFKLWGERLPKLDIGIDGDFTMDNFNLVNENSELDSSNKICIKEKFIIPKNEKNVSAPLILEDENIDYYMFLESSDMPFKEDVICNLTLQYSYDNENIYTLIFTPIDDRLTQMEAKWKKGKQRKNMRDIYPQYPSIKSIDELQHYPTKDNSRESDLFEWVEKNIKHMQNVISANVYRIEKNRCFARDNNGHEILCHKDKFINQAEWENINKGYIIYLAKMQGEKGYRGGFISKEQSITMKNILFNTRFPMIKIFNGHSLIDYDIPDSFRKAIFDFIEFMESRIDDINNKGLKEEFLLFCSMLHECLPKYLLDNIKSIKEYKIKSFAYSIGDAKLDFQKTILESVFKDNFIKQIQILAISLWRSKNLVFKISKNNIKSLIEESIKWIEKEDNFYTKDNRLFLANIIEVLLALLRLRQKYPDILHPSDEDTKRLIEKLKDLDKKITQNKATLKSYLNLEIEKPDKYKNMQDLIYALLSFISGNNSDKIKIIGVNDEA